MKVKALVFCTFEFEGFHCWPLAPIAAVAFLRQAHRHMFKVRAEAAVGHMDRQIEFITLKGAMEEVARRWAKDKEKTINWSCEMWAANLLAEFPQLTRVEVSEDGENGAVVEKQQGEQ